MLPTSEYSEFENRAYLNPQLSVDETNQFIDALRATQAENTAQTEQQTQALGTNTQSSLGGLGGAGSYFISRYQTPQTNSTVADLRAAAQADALNTVLANEQAMWKKRYNDAYRAYQKRQYDASKSPTNNQNTDGEVEVTGEVVSDNGASKIELDALEGREGYYSVVDPYTGEITDVPMDSGQQEKRLFKYTDIPINSMRNEKYTNEEGKQVWGWTYTLPSGKVVGVKYPRQKIVLGSDGNYYKYDSGTYSLLGR